MITRRGLLGGCLAGAAGTSPVTAAPIDARALPDERLRAQVCVIGGGSGGIGAAVAAARGGADVVLLERDAVLGGTSTTAWVHTWEPCVGADGIARDLYGVMRGYPLGVVEGDYGKGTPRVGGSPLPFEPHALIHAARRLLDATGRCRALFDTTFSATRVTGEEIAAVEAWFRGKRLLVEADVFIDCTADGDVCVDAGCDFHLGEDPKSRYGEPNAPAKAQPVLNSCTLVYRVTDTGTPQKPVLPKGVKEGSCPQPVCIRRLPNGDHLMNVVGMIASRAGGFSHIAASSCRLSRTMITLGQAAGTAAAMCVRNRIPPRQIDVAKLRRTLTSQRVTVSVD